MFYHACSALNQLLLYANCRSIDSALVFSPLLFSPVISPLTAGNSSCRNRALIRNETTKISREVKRLAAEDEGTGAGTLWLSEDEIRALAAPLCEEDLGHKGDEIVLGG